LLLSDVGGHAGEGDAQDEDDEAELMDFVTSVNTMRSQSVPEIRVEETMSTRVTHTEHNAEVSNSTRTSATTRMENNEALEVDGPSPASPKQSGSVSSEVRVEKTRVVEVNKSAALQQVKNSIAGLEAMSTRVTPTTEVSNTRTSAAKEGSSVAATRMENKKVKMGVRGPPCASPMLSSLLPPAASPKRSPCGTRFVLIVDADRNVVACNSGAAEVLKMDKTALVGSDFMELIPSEVLDQTAVAEKLSKAQSGSTFNGETMRFVKADSSTIDVTVNVSVAKVVEGGVDISGLLALTSW